MAYGTIASQLPRYYKACSSFQDFVTNTINLVTKLVQQNYDTTKIMSNIIKYVKSNKLPKYGISVTSVIWTITESLPSNFEVAGRP